MEKNMKVKQDATALRDYFVISESSLESSSKLDLDQPVLTPKEAAERYGMSGPSAVIRLAREGDLPSITIDEPLLIPLADADEWHRRRDEQEEVESSVDDETRAEVLAEFLESLVQTRQEFIEWVNASVTIENNPKARRGAGRPRSVLIPPSTRHEKARKIVVEEVKRRPEVLCDLLNGFEQQGVRDELLAFGHGRAFDLLDELEEGLDIKRVGPERPSGLELLELPGVWEEIEAWVEHLEERVAAGELSRKSRLEGELESVRDRLDHFGHESPMLFLGILTQFQLKSLASWLELPRGAGRDELIDTIAEEFSERYGPQDQVDDSMIGTVT